VHRLLVRPYVALVSWYFRRLKLPLSRLADLFRPKERFLLPSFASLEEFAGWLAAHTRWRPDPLAGAFDIFPSLKHLAWQLAHHGQAADDCDGLAYLAAQGALQFADTPDLVYVVTVVLDPTRLPLQQAAHVLCIFRHAGRWRVVSNSELYPQSYASFWRALTDNPHCQGHAILFYELRDAHLRPAREPAA